MEEFFNFVLQTLFWAFIFKVLIVFYDAWKVVKKESDLEEYKKLSNTIHIVKVENINGMEYWFNKRDDSFIAQGKTVDDVIASIKAQFPTHIFILENGGVAAKTDWKIVGAEEFANIKFKI